MGLTKQYLRYEAAGVFNLIGSHNSNVIFIEWKDKKTTLCAVGACENVIVWDLKKAEKVITLRGGKFEVTCLARCPRGHHLAAGYRDGSVNIYDLSSGNVTVTFSGHKSAVSALNYDKGGMRLVSGAKDTEVIVWDIVSESGLYRLRGHKGMITQAKFLSRRNVLITSSKDAFIKFWDLDTQHCFRTTVGHRTEIWDFVVVRDEACLITGSGDMEIRVWNITYADEAVGGEGGDAPQKKQKLEVASDDEEEDDLNILTCTKVGSFLRQGKDRVVSMCCDQTGRILGCHGPDSTLELFKIGSEEETRKTVQKRVKKARKRAREAGDDESQISIAPTLEDQIKRLTNIQMSHKIRSFTCYLDSDGTAKIVALLTNNLLETCNVETGVKKPAALSVVKLGLPGHRTDVRSVNFSSDNTAVLSASAESVKIWNRTTLQCIRTMSCDYCLCSVFAPGDRHIILGTKTGKLQIFDIAAGILMESVDAHEKSVWSICMAPDKKGILSGSADHDVKFWDFELIADEAYSATSKRLTLVHTRTLKMTDDILCVKFSPDHRLLAVSLLDNTVKVFFADTLKFFLSLYGHKLPVLCLDISSDSTLIVTGSADRNVKLWGLDFGDCHKSIFAHDDSIMCVQFVPKTHMFFTGGKDGKIKEWDGDSFDHIQTLEGHHGDVWCFGISSSGNFLLSGSHDKSLRLWEKTQEPLVLEEEREMEREKEYEEAIGEGGEVVIPGETNTETGIAAKKTVETVKAAERIMEAIELYKEESAKLVEYAAECKAAGKQLSRPPLHPLFQAYKVTTPTKYVLEVMKKVKSSELEESLIVLPFSFVMDLLKLLNVFLESDWEIELSCRCLFFLLRVHQGQITSNQTLLPVIDKLRVNASTKVKAIRDTIGVNMAALNFLQKDLQEREKVTLFADATGKFREKRRKKKPILTIRS